MGVHPIFESILSQWSYSARIDQAEILAATLLAMNRGDGDEAHALTVRLARISRTLEATR